MKAGLGVFVLEFAEILLEIIVENLAENVVENLVQTSHSSHSSWFAVRSGYLYVAVVYT